MNKIKSLLVLNAVLIFLGCSKWSDEWELDIDYSLELIVSKESDVLRSANLLQIYSIHSDVDHMPPTLASLRSGSLVCQIDDQSEIYGFLDFLKKETPQEKLEVTSRKSAAVFHIVAFDETLKRVGYFRYYQIKKGNYGVIRSLEDALFYVEDIFNFFEEPRANQ